MTHIDVFLGAINGIIRKSMKTGLTHLYSNNSRRP